MTDLHFVEITSFLCSMLLSGFACGKVPTVNSQPQSERDQYVHSTTDCSGPIQTLGTINKFTVRLLYISMLLWHSSSLPAQCCMRGKVPSGGTEGQNLVQTFSQQVLLHCGVSNQFSLLLLYYFSLTAAFYCCQLVRLLMLYALGLTFQYFVVISLSIQIVCVMLPDLALVTVNIQQLHDSHPAVLSD